jgi:hypothetical protein
MTKRWGMGLVAVVLLTAGCGDHHVARPEPRPSASHAAAPAYDAALPPTQAVLTLVPRAATTLTVTDFDQIRARYGEQPGAPGFWKRASRHSPLLSTGMLRPYAAQLHGFTPDDVSWEAHYSAADDSLSGWVLGFSATTDMSAVQQAATAGVGPLAGASIDAADHLATSRQLDAGDARWTDLAGLAGQLGPEAEATYLARGCLAGDTDGQRLQPLTAYAVSFGETLATAYLGIGRDDLFTRMRLGDRVPTFSADFVNGAADPSTGRIGFTMTDPVDAAQLALRSKLPFAVCAG